MLRQFTLQPNEDRRLQVEGKFLVVTQATGPIELNIGGTTPITVDEKDRIHMRDDSPNNRAIRIKNVSGGVNAIELHTSDLLIDKRTGVDVQNSIAIQEDQLVGIDPGANIVQAVIQNPVRFDVDENAVKIEAGQCVGIDPEKNTVNATVQNAIRIDSQDNTIKIDSGQQVGINPSQNSVSATIQNALRIDTNENVVRIAEPVQIESGQVLGIDPNANTIDVRDKDTAYKSLPTLTFEDAADIVQRTVTENPFRRNLILTAHPENFDPVWLGGEAQKGTPLFPGDRIEIAGANALTVAASTGQTLYCGELIYVGSDGGQP